MKKTSIKEIEQNLAQVAKNIDVEKISFKKGLRRSLLNSLQPNDSFYLINHIPSGKIEYISPSGYKILGIEKTNLSTKEFLSHFLEEDIIFFAKCTEIFFKFLTDLPVEKIKYYKGQNKLRIQKNKEELLEFLEQGIVFQTNKKGAFIRALVTFTDITHLNTDNTQTFSIIGLNGEPSYMNISIKQNTISKSKDLLTNREKTILSHLINGSTSNEIAETLNISIHTVNTHRKNILSKTNCNSTTELILKSMEMGWVQK